MVDAEKDCLSMQMEAYTNILTMRKTFWKAYKEESRKEHIHTSWQSQWNF